MGRSENVAIFENTRSLCKSNKELIQAIKESNAKQEVILENTQYEPHLPHYEEPTKIVVSKKRTFEAAQEYLGHSTCVLNFASATNPSR